MKETYLVQLGSTLRELRKERKLTQEDLADKAKINPNYYGRIERGEINLTLDTLIAISSGLNVSIADFFGRIPSIALFDSKKLQKEVQELVARLDRKKLQLVRDLLYHLS
jgi:transcriptional regulator with XRE-family HTH domain